MAQRDKDNGASIEIYELPETPHEKRRLEKYSYTLLSSMIFHSIEWLSRDTHVFEQFEPGEAERKVATQNYTIKQEYDPYIVFLAQLHVAMTRSTSAENCESTGATPLKFEQSPSRS